MGILVKSYIYSAAIVSLLLSGIYFFVLADTSSTSVTVANAAPTITAVTLNGGAAITLTENTTTSIAITATITDTNNCDDVFTSGTITAVLYRSGIANGSSCSASDFNCIRSITLVESGNTCNGTTDTTGDAIATTSLWYFANATDASSSFASETWTVAVTATDAASSAASSTASVELSSLYALNVTASLGYGSIAAGASSTADSVATTTNTGNFKIDTEISGTDMISGSFTVSSTNQRYGTSSAAHPNLTFQLSTSATGRDFNVPVAATSSNPTSTVTSFWRINIPSGSRTGSYTGTNTFTAIYSTD